MICQFFFSSIEDDFSWPVASFPVQQMNSKNLKVIVWKVIEVLSKKKVKNKHIKCFMVFVMVSPTPMHFFANQMFKTGCVLTHTTIMCQCGSQITLI